MATAKRVSVSSTDFITAWEGSESVAEVAGKLDMAPASVSNRATKYREVHNIPLKEMAAGQRGRKVDVGNALELLAKIRGKTVAELTA